MLIRPAVDHCSYVATLTVICQAISTQQGACVA
jgi:hypothetical protein